MTVVYDIIDFDEPAKQAAFLLVCFGEDWEEKAFLVNEPEWGIRKKLEDLDPKRGCYWCVGAIPWGKPRQLPYVENVRALVLDDVGTKIDVGSALCGTRILNSPTFITGTSEKNYQYIYTFENPPRAKEFTRFRRAMLNGLQGASDGKDAVHFFRLPWGVNRKPGREMFKVNGRFGIDDREGHRKPLVSAFNAKIAPALERGDMV